MSQTVLAEETSNFLVPNATFIVELIAFLIILAVLWRYVVPPVQRAMAERQQQIRAQLEESQQAKERLEAATAAYDSALAEARTEAAKIRDSARAEGQHIIDEMRTAAQEEAERVRQRAAYARGVRLDDDRSTRADLEIDGEQPVAADCDLDDAVVPCEPQPPYRCQCPVHGVDQAVEHEVEHRDVPVVVEVGRASRGRDLLRAAVAIGAELARQLTRSAQHQRPPGVMILTTLSLSWLYGAPCQVDQFTELPWPWTTKCHGPA